MKRFELFKNLMVMAAADGKLTEEEVAYLSLRSVHWGISDEQFQAALQNARDPVAELSLPGRKEECRAMLADLIRTMAVDGELADVEKHLFAIAAAHMKVSGSELDELLDQLLSDEP